MLNLKTIEQDIGNLVRHAHLAAEKAAAQAELDLSDAVKAAMTAAEAALAADAPEIDAAFDRVLKQGAQAIIQAVTAALEAHGL